MDDDALVLQALAAGAASTAQVAAATGLAEHRCRRALHRQMRRGAVWSPAYSRYELTKSGRDLVADLAAPRREAAITRPAQAPPAASSRAAAGADDRPPLEPRSMVTLAATAPVARPPAPARSSTAAPRPALEQHPPVGDDGLSHVISSRPPAKLERAAMPVGREEETGRDDGDHPVDRHNPVGDQRIDDRPADGRQERPYPAWRRRVVARRDTKPASAVIAGGAREVVAGILVGVGVGVAVVAARLFLTAREATVPSPVPPAPYQLPWGGFV